MVRPEVLNVVELLTHRERETLIFLLRGLSEQTIGVQMNLSKQTVHVYVKSLYRTFRVHDRGQLLALFVSPDVIESLERRCAVMRGAK